MMRRTMYCLVGLVVLGGAAPALAQLPGMQTESQVPRSDRSPESVLQAQLDAFNAHSVEAMTANIHEDFAWFAVDSDVMRVQMEGRAAFRESMTQYFANIPGARAVIEHLFVAGNFVTAVERAYWTQNGVENSQASLSVYEIREGYIYRVWYYPAYE